MDGKTTTLCDGDFENMLTYIESSVLYYFKMTRKVFPFFLSKRVVKNAYYVMLYSLCTADLFDSDIREQFIGFVQKNNKMLAEGKAQFDMFYPLYMMQHVHQPNISSVEITARCVCQWIGLKNPENYYEIFQEIAKDFLLEFYKLFVENRFFSRYHEMIEPL